MKRLFAIFIIWVACCGFENGYVKPLHNAQLETTNYLINGLVGYWIMNEDGSKIADLSLKRNHATNYGAKLSFGPKGPCLYFNGSSNYLLTPTMPLDETLDPISISVWFSANKISTALGAIFRTQDASIHNWALYHWSDNSISFYDGVQLTTNISVIPGKWYHVVVVQPSSSGNGRLYVNGVLNLTTIGRVPIVDCKFYIGSDEFGQEFNGKIDQFAIWDRDLTMRDVRYLYENQLGLIRKPPIISQPYLNFGSGGAPPVVVPKRRQSFIQIFPGGNR